MHLIVRQAVDDPASGVLQPAGHLDVVGLVKPGAQLHEHGDVLTVLRGLHQILHHLAVGGHPVEGHLDGHDPLVLTGLVEQLQEGTHTLKGIGEQHVLLPDLVDDAPLQIQRRGELGHAAGIEQVALGVEVVLQLGDKGQIQRRGGLEHMALLDAQIVRQGRAHLLAHGAAQFQTHRPQALAAADELLHIVPVVQILVVGGDGVQIGVAGDAHDGFFLHRVLAEELRREVEDELLTEHEVAGAGGDLNQAAEYAVVAGDDAHAGLAAPFQQRHGVELLIVQEGEGLLAGDDHGGEKRRDLGVEIALQQRALLVGELVEVDDAHAVGLQLAHELLIDATLLLLQLGGALDNGGDLLLGGHVGLVVPLVVSGGDLRHERAHANHEEFVQIGLVDGGEAEPLRQRHAGVSGLVQHPLVELQPAELPVGVAFLAHGDPPRLFDFFDLWLLLLSVQRPVAEQQKSQPLSQRGPGDRCLTFCHGVPSSRLRGLFSPL